MQIKFPSSFKEMISFFASKMPYEEMDDDSEQSIFDTFLAAQLTSGAAQRVRPVRRLRDGKLRQPCQ